MRRMGSILGGWDGFSVLSGTSSGIFHKTGRVATRCCLRRLALVIERLYVLDDHLFDRLGPKYRVDGELCRAEDAGTAVRPGPDDLQFARRKWQGALRDQLAHPGEQVFVDTGERAADDDDARIEHADDVGRDLA